MSFEALLWAANDAPIRDVNEFAVLVTLAERADPDGCTAFPSRATIAERTHIAPRTVLRTLQRLEDRGLIAKGDQRAAAYLRADRRPVVYDLLIPYAWFPNIERTNKERTERGRAALTPQSRPTIGDAPAKTRRSDLGTKRTGGQPAVRGVSQSPREEIHGVSLSPERGDSQSDTGCLTDTRTSPLNQPLEPAHDAPSARSAPDARRAPTGSGARDAGGCAASGKTKPKLTDAQRVLVREVLGLLPDGLRDVPELERAPRKVQDAVLEALAVGEPWERTPEQLVEHRVLPRWDRHWASLLFARGLARPVGPLVAMLKRDPLCNDPRCDEHVEVDTGRPCRVCASLRQDVRVQRAPEVPGRDVGRAVPAAEGAAGGPLVSSVGGASVLPGQRGAAEERVPAPDWTRGIGDGDVPSEEYRRQREAMRLRRAGA